MGKFIKNKSVFFLCIICLAGLSAAVTIEVESTPRQQMKYGMDYERLWFWYGSLDRAKCAELSVVDCNLDYLRVAIHCGYELEEGVFDESAYDKILEMMTYMKAANPNIKFFGSPRPLNDLVKDAPWCPFPLWINVYTQNDDGSWKYVEFKWEKAAEYLIRYVQFMKLHGFPIHYIDMTNEWNKVTPTHVKLMRARMEAELGDDMPLVIAPSAWSFTQGVNWLNDATNQDEIDAIDIPACHNTGNQGTPLDFATKAFSLGKEAWDSEMHGWVGKETIDEIPTSNVLWERVRAGFSGLDSWLALGTVNQQHCYILNKSGVPTPNVKYHIFKKVTNTSNYGYAITTSQPSEFESTAGFIKDNTATVWVLNNSSSDIADVEFKIDGHTILSDSVERTRWHHSISIEGVVDSVVKSSQTTFQSTIKANSLYCFHYQTESINNDNSMIANYKFDKNTYDSSGHGNNATIVGASNYSHGVIEN